MEYRDRILRNPEIQIIDSDAHPPVGSMDIEHMAAVFHARNA